MRGQDGGGVVIASRFWGETEDDFSRLWAFIMKCNSLLSDVCLMLTVAINEERDKIGSWDRIISRQQDLHLPIPLKIIRISPWGGVTHALNLLLFQALALFPESQFILFQSPEVVPDKPALLHLEDMMSAHPNTLVVGHTFKEHRMYSNRGNSDTETIITPLAADVCPWNTMALWNMKMLARTGFPAVADCVNPPGMEEVGVIALQQMLYGPVKAMARLYQSPVNISWINDFDDVERRERHLQKMATKASRAKEITQMLGMQEQGFCPLVEIHFTPCVRNNARASNVEEQASA